MAEETMKDFEKEIEESLKNRKKYEDPDAGKWDLFAKMKDEKQVVEVKITEVAGDAALMIDPHKVSDIKNAIIKLHDNPELAKEMVEKGIENVKRYDWKKEAQKLVDVAREF